LTQQNSKQDFLATRRNKLITKEDLTSFLEKIETHITNKKILVIGGAGSIGAAFIDEIAKYLPKSIHIIDQNENGLTNVVRDIRSNDSKISNINLVTSPLDFGSKTTEQFILDNGPYHVVYNFAAIKHVRSEKDIYSLMQMFDTNVLKHSKIIDFLIKNDLTQRYFSVSTDKTANPVSLMGASKKLMELVLTCKHLKNKTSIYTSSTRFPNVAFSNGSLLHSFPIRYEKKEPIPSPLGIERYFISHQEAAQICLLASIDLNEANILVPKINSNFKIYPIIDVAKNFISSKNLTPVVVESKEEGYKIINSGDSKYPILATKPDTTGEKEYEEFVGNNEEIINSNFINFDVVKSSSFNVEKLQQFLSNLNHMLSGEINTSKERLIKEISEIVPSFNHVETGINLDSRM
tara:strand:+ start:15261 stop:16478 length:1218 start_codon:yes stop_codon:yes gene_type:complete